MDRPITIRLGIALTALVGALVSLALYVAKGALHDIYELNAKMTVVESKLSVQEHSRTDMRDRLGRIEDKVDHLIDLRINQPSRARTQ